MSNVSVSNQVYIKNVTIASGETTSAGVSLGGGTSVDGIVIPSYCRLFAVVTPAALTGTALTIQGSVDGGTTWVPVYDKYGTELSIVIGTSRLITLEPTDLPAVAMIKLVSGSTEAADRVFSLVLRSV